MQIGFVEWPDGLQPHGGQWDDIAASVASARPDILVTNELPFGKWIASSSRFDAEVAAASVELHDRGLKALIALGVRSILGERQSDQPEMDRLRLRGPNGAKDEFLCSPPPPRTSGSSPS